MKTLVRCGDRFPATLVAALALSGAAAALAQDAPAPSPTPPAAPTAPAAPAPDVKPANLPAAKDLVAKHVAAIGGREALDKIKSSHYSGSIDSPMGKVLLEIATMKPNLVLIRNTMPGMGSQEVGFDGTTGWSTNPMNGGVEIITDPAVIQQMSSGADVQEMARDLEHRFETFETVGSGTLGGAECWKVVMKGKEGPAMVGFFDQKTGLLRGFEMDEQSPQGQVTQTITLGDWEKIDPAMAFKSMSISQMGMTMAINFDVVEFNALKESYFAPPAAVKEKLAAPTVTPATAPTATPTAPATPDAPKAP